MQIVSIVVYLVGLVIAAALSALLWFVAPFIIEEVDGGEYEEPTWKYVLYPFIWPVVLVVFLAKVAWSAIKKKLEKPSQASTSQS